MPNRILKEAIRTSDDVNDLTDFQFRLWAYLITYVDDYGRGMADPDVLKGFVFPKRKSVTAAQVGSALHDLANKGMISLYTVGGKSYFCFPSWSKHQTVRAKRSKYPSPDEADPSKTESAEICKHMQADASTCKQMQAHVSVIENREYENTRIENTRIENMKSEKRDPPYSPPTGDAAVEILSFDTFWAAYPRKTAKQAALKAFEKLSEDDRVKIMPALERQKRSYDWTKDGGRYVPYPATYLNGRRWEDELTTEIPKPAGAQELDEAYTMIAAWAESKGDG